MRLDLDVNGRRVEVEGEPMDRLLDVLREQAGLTGTKEGCGEGECGACTILLAGRPVLSCLVPLIQASGQEISTVEGLAEKDATGMIERMIAAGGIQCGACTPGIIVSAWALLQDRVRPSREAVLEALAGNLCRCTGYEGILRALATEGDLE